MYGETSIIWIPLWNDISPDPPGFQLGKNKHCKWSKLGSNLILNTFGIAGNGGFSNGVGIFGKKNGEKISNVALARNMSSEKSSQMGTYSPLLER
jgi:hypothetical protein